MSVCAHQYTMLSGRVPFQVGNSSDDQAAAIMHEIKIGRFNFDTPEWDNVSTAAKALIQGPLLDLVFHQLD